MNACQNNKTTEISKTNVKETPRKQASKRGAGKTTRQDSLSVLERADIQFQQRWHWKEEVILRTVIRGLGQKDHIYAAYYKTASAVRNKGIGTRVHSHTRVSAKINHLKL